MQFVNDDVFNPLQSIKGFNVFARLFTPTASRRLSANVFVTSTNRESDSKPQTELDSIPRPQFYAKPGTDATKDLSNETLREIFEWVMTAPVPVPLNEQNASLYATPIFSSAVPISPIPLTQVCRRWRRVATASRRLWQSIVIRRPSKHILPQVKVWIENANFLPLTIEFSQPKPESTEESQAGVEIIRLLCSRYRQWSEVNFHLQPNVFPQSLVRSIYLISRMKPPILNTISIQTSEENTQTDIYKRIWYSWQSLNKIECLVLSLNYHLFSLVPHSSSAYLQSLACTSISSLAVIEGIKTCVRLCHLKVVFPNSTIGAISERKLNSITPFELPNLRHLELEGISQHVHAFLRCFAFPNLNNAKLLSNDHSTLVDLYHLLDRSKASLARLFTNTMMMNNTPLHSDLLVYWLDVPNFHCLVSLSIFMAHVTDDALLRLTESNPHDLSFPNLEELILFTCTADVSDKTLITMLGSRLFTPEFCPPKVELRVARIAVRNKTAAMVIYERMCHDLIEAAKTRPTRPWVRANTIDSNGWQDRKVIIQHLP